MERDDTESELTEMANLEKFRGVRLCALQAVVGTLQTVTVPLSEVSEPDCKPSFQYVNAVLVKRTSAV